jgi:hypothetical protein
MCRPDIPVGDTRNIAPVLEGVYKDRQVALGEQNLRKEF